MEDSGENPFADPRSFSGRGGGGIGGGGGGGYGTNGSIAANPNAGSANAFPEFNPFAGDAPTQPIANQVDPLEGYNPFEKSSSSAPSAAVGAAPAVLQTNTPPPPYNPSPAQQIDTDHYRQQQRELDRKARELEDRERELKAKDERLRQQQQQQQQQSEADSSGVRKNWPPLPSWFPVKPCFYQDVEVEIPVGFQRIVKQVYYIWLAHVAILALNFIGGLAFLLTDGDITLCFLSLLYLAVLTPCSYVCWFRPIYKAFKSDSSLNFMIFFFVFCAQCGVMILNALGISAAGFCGILNGAVEIKTNVAIGIICIVIGVLAALLASVSIFTLMQIHKLYRSKDGVSMAQARKEGVKKLMSNKDVRDTVVDVGAAAATAAATGN